MHIDITRFLRSFGISLAEGAGAVNGDRRSEVTCFRCRCPLHQDNDGSLVARRLSSTGETRFECNDPRCRFSGDAVSLVAVKRGIPVSDAIKLFRPGGELAGTLDEPLGTVELEAYLDEHGAQSSVKAYMAASKKAFMQSPGKAGIAPGLSASTARHAPDGVGLFVNTGVPAQLSELARPALAKKCVSLYWYTYDGDVSYVEARDPSNPLFRLSLPVTRRDMGVFREDLSSMFSSGTSRTLFATVDPVASSRLQYSYMMSERKEAPVVSFDSLPLPDSFSNVTTVVLVSLEDAPVSLKHAMSFLSADQIVAGSERGGQRVKVYRMKARSSDVQPSEAVRVLSGCPGRDVAEWCASEMVSLVAADREKEVADAIAAASLPQLVSSAMSRYVRTCSENREVCIRVAEMLDKPVEPQTVGIVLANGRTVRRGPSSLSAVTARGADTISNVGLSVESKVVSYSGEEVLSCSVSPQDRDVPNVRVNLPESSWDSGQKIQRIVSKAFVARGFNPYVAFYDVKGFSWRDILCRLGERCPVSKEVARLGVDDVSDIQLPGFVASPTGEIREQSRVFTLPENVTRVYGGLSSKGSEDGVDPYRKCLASCDNLYVAAFTLGVMHVLYQMTYGVYRPSSRRHACRHLFYVETEPGIWQAAFKQVADLFSGADFTPTVGYADPLSFLNEYVQLGTLPLIAYVPTMGSKFAKALDDSTVDMVGLVDTTTAVMVNGKVPAVYITPVKDVPQDRSVIGGRDLDALRASFPALLSKFLTEARIDHQFRSSSTPCLATYSECCRILGVDESKLVDDIAKTWFPGTGMNGANMFFDLLHRGVSGCGKPKVCVVQGPPQAGTSFTRRGQHAFVMERCVILSHMLVDMVNQVEKGVLEFSVGQLSEEMSERGMLASIPDDVKGTVDPDRCWCISREVWETCVVRPPINLSGRIESGELKLAEKQQP